MNDRLGYSLKKKGAFLELEAHILEQARVFYKKGFFPEVISASQMAAVGERLRSADSFEDAKKETIRFLSKQLEKLKARQERTQKRTSWCSKPLDNEEEETLGDILKQWIDKERYMEGIKDLECLDHLSVLRRFWSSVYGQYRFKKVFGEDMSLEEEAIP